MRRLSAFVQVTLDGYFARADGDIGRAHDAGNDEEWNAFVAGNAQSGGVLVFGRITYAMMAAFWPAKAAIQTMPAVAEAMNSLQKIVFSRAFGNGNVPLCYMPFA
jgi:dihydrofolate reductase